MIGYDVRCYRCRETENGTGANETEARERIEAFKQTHRSKCGTGATGATGASFSSNLYSVVRDSLLGVVEPPAFPEVDR